MIYSYMRLRDLDYEKTHAHARHRVHTRTDPQDYKNFYTVYSYTEYRTSDIWHDEEVHKKQSQTITKIIKMVRLSPPPFPLRSAVRGGAADWRLSNMVATQRSAGRQQATSRTPIDCQPVCASSIRRCMQRNVPEGKTKASRKAFFQHHAPAEKLVFPLVCRFLFNMFSCDAMNGTRSTLRQMPTARHCIY